MNITPSENNTATTRVFTSSNPTKARLAARRTGLAFGIGLNGLESDSVRSARRARIFAERPTGMFPSVSSNGVWALPTLVVLSLPQDDTAQVRRSCVLFRCAAVLLALFFMSPMNSAFAQKGQSKAGSRLGGYTTPPPANNVPDHPFNILVGRLTDRSGTVRVLFHNDVRAMLDYGSRSGELTRSTKAHDIRAGEPFDFVIDSLPPNSRCYYRLTYELNGSKIESDEYSFHTQRAPGEAFVFTVQADSHLDENTSGDVYLQTLANALADLPDFHFALGDTFMTGKYVQPELSEPQYLAQRYYLGHLCHSSALYFALGNHDGENGNRGSNIWATNTRKRYIPNPQPNSFYTGNDQSERGVGLPENYYQFEWGGCQFVVLDPFRYTTTRSRGDNNDNWYWTLGEHQYQWLKRSLEQSNASLRFVFLHHLVGGSDRNQRGGVEAAPFWEWGGKSASGKDEFRRHRPGWSKPIHQLLVEHGVDIVFHGHDHMFIKQDLDGIVYQLVPQPGHPRSGTKSAEEYGYMNGEIQGSSGFVRVRTDGQSARVDYVRTYLPEAERGNQQNGDATYSYVIEAQEVKRKR